MAGPESEIPVEGDLRILQVDGVQVSAEESEASLQGTPVAAPVVAPVVAPTTQKIWSYEKTNPYYDPSGKGFEKGTKRYSESSYEQQIQKMLAEKQPTQEEPVAKTTVATEVAKNEQFQKGLMTAAVVGGLYYAATKR